MTYPALLVGEYNPVSPDPRMALYPHPPGSAAWRLCHHVLRMRRNDYLRTFRRVNVLRQERWDWELARKSANRIHLLAQEPVLVLLGVWVAALWDLEPMQSRVLPQKKVLNSGPEQTVVAIPHPSGRSHSWNNPRVAREVRRLLRRHLPDAPFDQLKTHEEQDAESP